MENRRFSMSERAPPDRPPKKRLCIKNCINALFYIFLCKLGFYNNCWGMRKISQHFLDLYFIAFTHSIISTIITNFSIFQQRFYNQKFPRNPYRKYERDYLHRRHQNHLQRIKFLLLSIRSLVRKP